MNDPLVWVRTVHFAATISVVGAIFFRGFIAEPAFAIADNNGCLPSAVRSQLAWIVWAGLGLLVVTGAMWLVLISQQMADLPLGAALSQGMVWTVLGSTDFGHDWAVRLILAGLLAGTLVWRQFGEMTHSRRTWSASAVLAAGLVGTLAWSGHAAAKSSFEGKVHLSSQGLQATKNDDLAGAIARQDFPRLILAPEGPAIQ
jgi:copper resistance protein D